ncbi:MBL fold metallo-hydrolase [Myxococcota bacterium]|nr:MBL fold metallo-hydrolase [Myxococcota bacterium]MCZ7618207.1 MBL fold metallo-hydrolase [Myxococcota bacterium]
MASTPILASMLGPLGHIAALLAYLPRRHAQAATDAATQRDLAWSRSPRAGDLPAGLELEWLGTAGFRLHYEGRHLLIDPYCTRISLGDLLRRRPVAADPRRFGALPDPLAILVGHTHFDHALDVPALARRAGCPVYGSASLVQLMKANGVAPLAVPVEPHRRYEIGPFEVRFVPSRHSRLALGLWTPSDGELTCEHTDALTPRAYRCGQVWGLDIRVAGVRFYHQGSCDLVDDEIRDGGVDYLLAGIAGRRFTARYWQRLLGRLEPRVIVPHHFDDFFRPLDAPFGYSLNVNLGALPDEIARVSRDFELRTLTVGECVRGARPGAGAAR